MASWTTSRHRPHVILILPYPIMVIFATALHPCRLRHGAWTTSRHCSSVILLLLFGFVAPDACIYGWLLIGSATHHSPRTIQTRAPLRAAVCSAPLLVPTRLPSWSYAMHCTWSDDSPDLSLWHQPRAIAKYAMLLGRCHRKGRSSVANPVLEFRTVS